MAESNFRFKEPKTEERKFFSLGGPSTKITSFFIPAISFKISRA